MSDEHLSLPGAAEQLAVLRRYLAEHYAEEAATGADPVTVATALLDELRGRRIIGEQHIAAVQIDNPNVTPRS